MATIMAPPPAGLVSRSQTLTNSAAEFLELRCDGTLGAELAETSPEFAPELDQFVPRELIPPQDYFAESQARLETFKTTLAAFQKNLVDRKADKKYEIEIKDANSYTLDDVLKIAQTVQKKHKDVDDVHDCMKSIKKFFRATGRNATTFKRLLTFVPDDVYGSVICGGFTVILGALERSDTLRLDMYTALDQIPTTLRRIHELLGVHFQSPQLKSCGDAVLVNIFVLLELIVRELSGSLSKKIFKATLKGDRYGAAIDEATKALEGAVKDFETQARICDAKRLGRVEGTTQHIFLNTVGLNGTAKRTEQAVQQLGQDIASRHQQFAEQLRADQVSVHQKLIETQEEALDEFRQAQLATRTHGAQVLNQFYIMLAANPSFDSKTGTLDLYEAQKRIARALTPESMDTEIEKPTQPFSDTNQSLVKSWIRASRDAPKIAARDLRHCLADLGARPSLAEQDRVAYILTAPEIRDWLRSVDSRLMVVDINSERGTEHSAASYASALLIHSIQKIGRFPVLYHFCAVRGTAHNGKNTGDMVECYASLIAQLLRHLSQGPDLNLEFLTSLKRRLKEGRCKLRSLRSAFQELVRKVSQEDWLFIIVDSLWKLQHSDDDVEVQKLLKFVKSEGVRIKLFVTEPFSLHILEPLTSWEARRLRRAKKDKNEPPEERVSTLHVPDKVDGHHSGFNVSWIKEEVKGLLGECSSSQADSTSDTESEEADESDHDAEVEHSQALPTLPAQN